MDTEMIYRAIRACYKEKVPEDFPENYLRKILQISFYLPEMVSNTCLGSLNTFFSATAQLEFQRRVSRNGGQPGVDRPMPPPPADGGLPYDLGRVLKIVPVQLR
jgi:hypothetical protein